MHVQSVIRASSPTRFDLHFRHAPALHDDGAAGLDEGIEAAAEAHEGDDIQPVICFEHDERYPPRRPLE